MPLRLCLLWGVFTSPSVARCSNLLKGTPLLLCEDVQSSPTSSACDAFLVACSYRSQLRCSFQKQRSVRNKNKRKHTEKQFSFCLVLAVMTTSSGGFSFKSSVLLVLRAHCTERRIRRCQIAFNSKACSP